MRKPERAGLVIIHLAPPNIDSGGAIDARDILLYISEKHRDLCKASILITNDKKLLRLLTEKKSTRCFKRIYYIPVNEAPLYSYRLSLLVPFFMLKYLKKEEVVFLMEEYPTILIPITLLSYMIRKRILIKYHSYAYILSDDYFKIVLRSIPEHIGRVFYAFLSFIVTFSLKILRDAYLLAPNRDLAFTLNRVLNKRRAFFIPSGNFMDPLPTKFLRIHSSEANKCFCTLSSKIDLLTVKLAQIFANVFSIKVMLYGKLYGPQEKVVKSIIESSSTLAYKGVFPTREELLKNISSNCERVFYVVTAYETWSYSLYELLSIFRTVIVFFPSARMMKVITSLYEEIFNGHISIAKGNHFAIFRLEKPIDETFLEKLNKEYVEKICRMIKLLME
jgi:hypothetical protein